MREVKGEARSRLELQGHGARTPAVPPGRSAIRSRKAAGEGVDQLTQVSALRPGHPCPATALDKCREKTQSKAPGLLDRSPDCRKPRDVDADSVLAGEAAGTLVLGSHRDRSAAAL